KNDYMNKQPNLSEFSRPSIPSGSDSFPVGIQAVANKNLNLYVQKGNKTTIANTINKGSYFSLLEKTNDFWVKVMVGTNVYWTDDIQFDKYKDYLSVQNLGRVNSDGLNVRPDPSTGNSPIAVLKNNQYVQILLDQSGKLIMDNYKNWYNVQLPNGLTGWVSSQYISLELK
ncbi:MAG: SH3 domain-containing protein, partial [Bacillota bacterium]|nr:SH3 domain-containing protein [Bacillota bacterium]